MLRATVITDASYCPQTDAGGFGAYVRVDGFRDAFKYSGPLHPPINSSTFAEVRASLNGVWYAARHGATNILLQTDCMTIMHLDQGRCRNIELVKLWLEAFARPDMKDVRLSTRHVKGHGRIKDARTWVNAWCDDIARQHMVAGRKAKYKELRA